MGAPSLSNQDLKHRAPQAWISVGCFVKGALLLVMNRSTQPVRMKKVAFASLFSAASLLLADAVHADNFRVDYSLFENRREPEFKVPSRLTRPEVAQLAEWRRVPVYAPIYGSASAYGYGPAYGYAPPYRSAAVYGYVPPYHFAATYGYGPAYGYAPTRRYAPAYGYRRAYGYVARRTDARDRRRDWRWPSPGWPIYVKK
jgi:hypothetical protein